MKGIAQILLIAVSVWYPSCDAGRQVASYTDRNAIGSVEEHAALKLIVEVGKDGTLSLNRIKTGSVENTTHLRDSIKAIFEDRTRNGIAAREVIVVLNDDVKKDDLDDLFEALESVNVGPLHIVERVSE